MVLWGVEGVAGLVRGNYGKSRGGLGELEFKKNLGFGWFGCFESMRGRPVPVMIPGMK